MVARGGVEGAGCLVSVGSRPRLGSVEVSSADVELRDASPEELLFGACVVSTAAASAASSVTWSEDSLVVEVGLGDAGAAEADADCPGRGAGVVEEEVVSEADESSAAGDGVVLGSDSAPPQATNSKAATTVIAHTRTRPSFICTPFIPTPLR